MSINGEGPATIAKSLRKLALLLDKQPARAAVVLLEAHDGHMEILTLGDLNQMKVLGMFQLGIHEMTHPDVPHEEGEVVEKVVLN